MSRASDLWMATDILIRTYSGDFEWLDYCLRSGEKRLKGFRDVVLVASDKDAPILRERYDYRVCESGEDWEDGYIQQMNDKLHADSYSDADYICHTDSDCVWIRDLSPEDLMENGKPVWLMHPFTGDDNPWPPIVEKILGFKSRVSFMRRHPFTVPRKVYKQYRDWLEARHSISVRDYIKKQPYMSFIEYESFGAWAYEYAHEEFTWKDQGDFPVFIRQGWSWGGLSDQIKGELEEICK